MILKRRYCRKHGHDLDPDPGDLVLHCLRCGAMVDLSEVAAATRLPAGRETVREPDRVILTAAHYEQGMNRARELDYQHVGMTLWLHNPHAEHCAGYDVAAWPCPPAIRALEWVLCRYCGKDRPCAIHDWHGDSE